MNTKFHTLSNIHLSKIRRIQIPNESKQGILDSTGFTVDPIIKEKNLIHSPGTCYVAIWNPGRSINSEDAIKEIGYTIEIIEGKKCIARPATTLELAVHEIAFPKAIYCDNLVALGDKILIDNKHYAVVRSICESRTYLNLGQWSNDPWFPWPGWPTDFSFLITFEEINEPEQLLMRALEQRDERMISLLRKHFGE